MSCGRGFAAIVMLAVSLVGVSAQEVSSQASPPAPPRVVVGEEGIALESGNGDYRLQIGLLLHADGRFALADESEQYVDNFVVRRFRPYLRGRLGRHFEFFMNPDFAGGTLTVQDAYVDTIFAPAFRIRAGKGKTPFGFERLQPAANMLFMERAFPTALAPNRDIGVQVLGDLSGGVVSYLAGVMNGVADGASADVETNDGKDLSGRLVLRPFNRAKPGPPLEVSVSASRLRAAAPAACSPCRCCDTQTLQQPYFRMPSPVRLRRRRRCRTALAEASGISTRPSAGGPNTCTRGHRSAAATRAQRSTMTRGRLRARGC